MNITIFPTNNTDGSGTGTGDYKIGETAIFNPNNVPDGFVQPQGQLYNLIDYPQLDGLGFQKLEEGDISNSSFNAFGGNIGIKPYAKTKQFFANGTEYIVFNNDDGAGNYEIVVGEWNNVDGFVQVASIQTTQDLSNNNTVLLVADQNADTSIFIGFGNTQIEYFIFDSVANSITTGTTPLSINNTTELSGLSENSRPFVVYSGATGKYLLFCNVFNSNSVPALVLYSNSTINDDTSFVKESEAPNNAGIYYNEIINDNFFYLDSYYLYAFPEDQSAYYILKIDAFTLDITIHKDLGADLGIDTSYLSTLSMNNIYTNVQVDYTNGNLYHVLLSELFSPTFLFLEYDIQTETHEEKNVAKSTLDAKTTGYIMNRDNSGNVFHFFAPNRTSGSLIDIYAGQSIDSVNKQPYNIQEFNDFNFNSNSIHYDENYDNFVFSGNSFTFYTNTEQSIPVGFSIYNLPYESVVIPQYGVQGLVFEYAQTYIYIGEPNIVS